MTERATAERSSIPLALIYTSAGLWALGAVALTVNGRAQPAFALFCGVVSVAPFRGHTGQDDWGRLLCYALAAWSLFGLAPLATIGEALGGPYGGHPMLFVVGLVLAVLRLRVLASPAVKSWLRP